MNTRTVSERRIRNNKIRRTRQLRRHIFLSIIILVATIAGTVSITTLKSSAKDNSEPTYFKYYTSIVVQPGDTLWSIAEDYMSEQYESIEQYTDEVMNMNSLSEETIHAGQYIIVPYYSTEYVGL